MLKASELHMDYPGLMPDVQGTLDGTMPAPQALPSPLRREQLPMMSLLFRGVIDRSPKIIYRYFKTIVIVMNSD